MNRNVFVDGATVTLAPAALLGQGGEAEVYDLGDGRVVKWWKPADHPDFDGMPDAQAAAHAADRRSTGEAARVARQAAERGGRAVRARARGEARRRSSAT